MLKHIPNLLTLSNLLSGCIAVVFAFEGQLDTALFFVLLASLFDFLDGFAARAMNAYSETGKQLDSLADAISFGFAPAAMLYVAAKPVWSSHWISFTPFLLTLFSAVRLAKFNIDTRQNVDFLGLPTPANAIFFISFANLVARYGTTMHQLPIISVILVFSMLMVVETRLFSLKKVGSDRIKLVMVGILTIGAIVSLVWLNILAGVVIIPYYIVLSFLYFSLRNKNSDLQTAQTAEQNKFNQ